MKDDFCNDNPHWEKEKNLTNSIDEKNVLFNKLKEEEQDLDNIILQMQNEFGNMIEEEDFKKYAYITHSDLKNICSKEKNVNLIAIKAPVKTTIEVPDPNIMEKVYQETKLVNYFIFLYNFILQNYFS